MRACPCGLFATAPMSTQRGLSVSYFTLENRPIG
jgi:hypothetical protein